MHSQTTQHAASRVGALKSAFKTLGSRTVNVNDLRLQGAAACVLQLLVTVAFPIVWYILVYSKDSRLLPVPIVSWAVTVVAACLGVAGFLFLRSLLLGLHAALAVSLAAALGAFHTHVYLLLADRCDRTQSSFSGCSACSCALSGTCSRADLDAGDCTACRAWPADVCSGLTKSGLPYMGLVQLVFVALPALFSLLLLVRLEKENHDLAGRLMYARSVVTRQLERLEAGRTADVDPGLLQQLLGALVAQGGPLDRAVARQCGMMMEGAGGWAAAAAAGDRQGAGKQEWRDVEAKGAPAEDPGVMAGPSFALPSSMSKARGEGDAAAALRLKSSLRRPSAAAAGPGAEGDAAWGTPAGFGGDRGGAGGLLAPAAGGGKGGGEEGAGQPGWLPGQSGDGDWGAGEGGAAEAAGAREVQERETRERASLWATLDSDTETERKRRAAASADAGARSEDPVLRMGSHARGHGGGGGGRNDADELTVASFTDGTTEGVTEGDGEQPAGLASSLKKKKKKKSVTEEGPDDRGDAEGEGDKPKRRKKKKSVGGGEEGEGGSGADDEGVGAVKKKKKKKKLLGAGGNAIGGEEGEGGSGADDEGVGAVKKKKKKKKLLGAGGDAISGEEGEGGDEGDGGIAVKKAKKKKKKEMEATETEAGTGTEAEDGETKRRRRKKSNKVEPEDAAEDALVLPGGVANDMDLGLAEAAFEELGTGAKKGRKSSKAKKSGWVAA